MIQIDMLTVGMFQSNCYLVSCSETREAVIVDAGDEAERILEAVAGLGLRVGAVIATHAHLDHVAALPEVVDALGVPVWMHRDELRMYEGLGSQAAMFGLQAPGRVPVDRLLEDGEVVTVGNSKAEILLTPGHSPGEVCIGLWGEHPPILLSGDVLFQGSIGRTDLPGGDYGTIMETLRTRFVPMPDETVVYPGHGPATTIGHEKKTNPFLAPLSR